MQESLPLAIFIVAAPAVIVLLFFLALYDRIARIDNGIKKAVKLLEQIANSDKSQKQGW